MRNWGIENIGKKQDQYPPQRKTKETTRNMGEKGSLREENDGIRKKE